MNRVRMGMTGLAFVFLVVMIAAAGLHGPNERPQSGGVQEDTLATLGVAPGADGPKSKTLPPAKQSGEVMEPLPPIEPLILDDDESLTEI